MEGGRALVKACRPRLVSKQTAPAEFRSVGRPRRGAGGWNLDSFEGDGGIMKLAIQLTKPKSGVSLRSLPG